MKLRASIVVGLLIAALSAHADVKLPVLKVGSEVYSNVTVINKSSTDIYFTHAGGMGNAKLKKLDPDLQKRFGYDAAKAGAFEMKQAEANMAYRKQVLSEDLARSPRLTSAAVKNTSKEAAAPGDIPVREIHARSFLGRPAPQFVVEKWLTAKPDYSGKFLLIDFWATWAGPCLRSIPALNALHAKFKDRLVVVGLSDEPEEDVRKMTSPRIDYNLAIDTSATMTTALEVRGIPYAVILDPNGIVRFEGHPGYLSTTAVAGLLAKYSK